MDSRITEFIQKHHVMTLATSRDNAPYCANLFYAYNSEERCFVFTTDSATLHGSQAEENSSVAASIVVETKVVGIIKGIQITGRMLRPTEEQKEMARKLYLKRFPYAAAMELDLWILWVDFAKLTHNALGFGKKLIWRREDEE